MPRALLPFEYIEPDSVDSAATLLSTWREKARILAGGVALVDEMRRRVTTPDCVVSIRKIRELNHIRDDMHRGLSIGAMATIREVEVFLRRRTAYQSLYESIGHIPSLQVKSMATVVGNLCVASPVSDIAPTLMTLGAQVTIVGPGYARNLPLEEFFLGLRQTALGQGELVTEVRVPALPEGVGGAFLRLARTSTDVAKLNVAAMVRVSDGLCQDVRIAVGAVAPTPLRLRTAEAILRGHRPDEERTTAAAMEAVSQIRPITDVRSTAAYRKEMTGLLLRRALRTAFERAQAGDRRGAG